MLVMQRKRSGIAQSIPLGQLYHAYFKTKGMKSFSLSGEDAQDKNDWRSSTKEAPANPGLPGKWLLKRGCVCVWSTEQSQLSCEESFKRNRTKSDSG